MPINQIDIFRRTDVIYLYASLVIPIEVKSGHNAHLKSLHQFMNETPHDIAVRVWAGKYSIDEVRTAEGKSFRLVNLPFYLLAALPEILSKL